MKDRDRDIDDVLNQAGGPSPNVDPALLAGISESIGACLSPVRPLPPHWILVTALVAGCMAVASVGGMLLGLHGLQKMGAAEIVVILPVLGILIWLAASVSVGEMIPGSRHRMDPGALLAAGCATLIAVFALLFHDYGAERFVPQGVSCLAAGLLHAVPTAIIGWLVLHRGFAVNSVAAGFAQGVLAGLAGVSMLELHCPNFEAPHLMVWHTAVLPVSGAMGALLAWAGRSLSRRKP